MPRFLIYLVLVTSLVVVPSVRVLCSGSCVPEPQAHAASSSVPDCHERDAHDSSSEPLGDDCRHAGEASSSSLSASAKSVGASGTASTLGAAPVVTHFVVSPGTVTHRESIARSTGQSLGLFLTPLRI